MNEPKLNTKELKNFSVPQKSKVTKLQKLWWRFEDWLIDNYPGIYSLKPRWNSFWYEQISSRLRPRNKWLTKKLPRTWCDKVELIPIVLYEMVIHFVEDEKCFERLEYRDIPEEEKMIKEIYDWAKTGRKAFIEKIDNSYPPLEETEFVRIETGEVDGRGRPYYELKSKSKKSYEELYGELNKLEAEFTSIDNKYLSWIVLNRERLWT
jgi:hypothetical protein